jgi:hypothetical protein
MKTNLISQTHARTVFALTLAVVFALNLVSAAPVKLMGPLSWEINGGSITITAKSVNNTGAAMSGDLRLEVWAFTSLYKGQSLSGYRLGSYDLGQLAGKHQFAPIDVTMAYNPPAYVNNDAYYTTIFQYEYKNNAWVVDSYYSFNSTVPLDSGYEGGLSMGATGSKIRYNGLISYDIFGSEVTLGAATIENGNANYKISGTLKMQLWATTTPYTSGTINGYVLGEYTIGQLGHGNHFFNVDNTVGFSSPPSGTYYLTMTLDMYNKGVYKIFDHVSFSGTHNF